MLINKLISKNHSLRIINGTFMNNGSKNSISHIGSVLNFTKTSNNIISFQRNEPIINNKGRSLSIFQELNKTSNRYYSSSNEQKQQQDEREQKQQQQQQQKKGLSLRSKLLIGGLGLFIGSTVYFKYKYGEDFKIEYLKRIPFRVTSNIWGKFANIELPHSLRSPFYLTYSKLFGVNVDEVEYPIDSYKSMADFFCRRLKAGSRQIDSKADMVSPVDGTVIYFGKIDKNTLEQVKGLSYSLNDFLGEDLKKSLGENKNLYHVALYLSPGDYHGIHSPVDWKIKDRYHFPGYLFPVAKVAVDNIPGLFAMNERVVLAGNWKHGFFSLTPVGASNVGSIVMDFDKEIFTNNQLDDHRDKSNYYYKSYKNSIVSSNRGNEVAFFKMGSTVVLIFEVPQDKSFKFDLTPGKTVKYGEPIGNLIKQ